MNSTNFDLIKFVNYLREICESEKIINKFIIDRSTELIFKSSLYVLEDTGLVIKFYDQYNPESSNVNHLIKTSHLYLHIYGILQAMYMQQDAIINICEIFNVMNKKEIIKNYFSDIRDIRNSSVGHPANRLYSKNNRGQAFISQISVGSNYFQYLQVKNGNSKTVKVKISEILDKQNKAMEKISGEIKFWLLSQLNNGENYKK